MRAAPPPGDLVNVTGMNATAGGGGAIHTNAPCQAAKQDMTRASFSHAGPMTGDQLTWRRASTRLNTSASLRRLS